MIKLSQGSEVYATNRIAGTGHAKDVKLENEYGWNKVSFFDDKYIVKIAVGYSHSLFLDDNGTVFASGYNRYFDLDEVFRWKYDKEVDNLYNKNFGL